MRPLVPAAAVLLVLGTAACSDSEDDAGPAPDCEAGAFTVVDEEALGDYTYSLSFPCPEPESTLATVIVLHGSPGSGWGARSDSNMDVLAEEEGFMAVYPTQPTGTWDAAADGDDIAFVSDLIDELVEHWSADPERIYVSGFSNGGDMTLAVGAHLTDEVAAIAPVTPSGTGSVTEAVETMSEPLPRIAFVGTTDGRWGEAGQGGLDLWIERGGCESEGTVEEAEDYTAESWTCAGGAPALEYRVDGGHVWFGSPTVEDRLWASRVMWDFFSESAG